MSFDTMNLKVSIDTQSRRYKNAAIRTHFTKTLRIGFGIAVGAGLVLAGLLIVVGVSLGWAVAGISLLLMMPLIWRANELEKLPVIPGRAVTSLSDIVATDVLSLMAREKNFLPTPKELATIVGQLPGAQFFGTRFGVSPRFLQDISSEQKGQTETVWQESLDLQEKLELPEITAGCIAVALVKQMPNIDSLLAHLHIDTNDLVEGLRWQSHIYALIDKHDMPKKTGGIARDWSFGYVPLLSRFGQNISEQIERGGRFIVNIPSHVSTSQKMSQLLVGPRRNAALVGAVGAGKTTIIESFAAQLLDGRSDIPASLRFHQVFLLDASRMIAAAPGRGEIEGLVSQLLSEAYAAKNIIIVLESAELFFEDRVGSVDLTNLLLPVLEAGRLQMILTMDEQRLLQISVRNGSLTNALNRVSIEETDEKETIQVLQEHLLAQEYRAKVACTYQALIETYRLSRRYVQDMVMPGRAVKLLDLALMQPENGFITINSVHKALEQSYGIKVGAAQVVDSERQKLLGLEDLIHQRMINQTRAVNVVSDALRRARSGVRKEDRPIGTFLFLGPTGVGKTELAKALADVYFEGEQNLIRLDMNEFVQPSDVSRLIADGADNPMSLTAQIRKKPFSVVLLDEIEKAHPQVLTTLLQLLDEGILRDSRNNEISFQDAIIIASSNAGADRIREYIERGYNVNQFEEQLTNELISSNQFRPEFLNRFDEIVIFRPLDKPELLQVVDLILAGINKTLAPRKISVTVEENGKLLLVDKGYDPRLGARPMRRIVQKTVENTLARQMLGGEITAGSNVVITKKIIEDALLR